MFCEEYEIYKERRIERKRLRYKLQEHCARYEKAKGIRYDREAGTGGSGDSDPMLTYCIRKEELEKEIAELDAVIAVQAQAFEELINSTIRSGAWRAIAKACFVHGESVADVARQISRTEGHVANVKTKVYRILSQS